jgi:2-keto-3-deoxy-galactonokinase
VSYLSGLLIGEELHQQKLDGQEVIAIGAPALTARYALVLGKRGVRVQPSAPRQRGRVGRRCIDHDHSTASAASTAR